jgi:CheY-like chemotaxis protein
MAASEVAQLARGTFLGVEGGMKRLRVLLVDDCLEMMRPLALLLNRWGHEVSEASNGPHALGLASEKVFDAFLLDIDMPGMDGFELAAALRQQEAHAAALLIAATGHTEEEYQTRAVEVGFNYFLTKPISVRKLSEFFRPVTSAIPA